MTMVLIHQNGDLSVPARAENEGILGDGTKRLAKGTEEWTVWNTWIAANMEEAEQGEVSGNAH